MSQPFKKADILYLFNKDWYIEHKDITKIILTREMTECLIANDRTCCVRRNYEERNTIFNCLQIICTKKPWEVIVCFVDIDWIVKTLYHV
jgi:hypothetical protein